MTVDTGSTALQETVAALTKNEASVLVVVCHLLKQQEADKKAGQICLYMYTLHALAVLGQCKLCSRSQLCMSLA